MVRIQNVLRRPETLLEKNTVGRAKNSERSSMITVKFTIKQDGTITDEIVGVETIPMKDCLKKIRHHIDERLLRDDTLYEEILKDAEWDEKRMDVIGQNGNDGLHYEDEYYEREHTSECS